MQLQPVMARMMIWFPQALVLTDRKAFLTPLAQVLQGQCPLGEADQHNET